MAYVVERRWPRFRISVPAVVEVLGQVPPGKAVVAGSTRDVSAGGVYVVSQEFVVAGARVRVQVDLSGVGMRLAEGGEVVRCEEWGFAVAFDSPVEGGVDLPRGAGSS